MNKKSISKSENNIAFVFKRIASAISGMSQDELSRFVDEAYEIEIRFVRKRQKSEMPIALDNDLKDTISLLSAFKSRDEALLFVTQNFETKKNLELLCRQLDIPILKSDKADTLRDKIVEATTGSRIRSDAIQGKYDLPRDASS